MAEWKMIYRSRVLEREAQSVHESLEQALHATWALSWREGEVMRIEGPQSEKLDADTIARHPKRPK
jgi:hypothetical protein